MLYIFVTDKQNFLPVTNSDFWPT